MNTNFEGIETSLDLIVECLNELNKTMKSISETLDKINRGI